MGAKAGQPLPRQDRTERAALDVPGHEVLERIDYGRATATTLTVA